MTDNRQTLEVHCSSELFSRDKIEILIEFLFGARCYHGQIEMNSLASKQISTISNYNK